MDRTRLPRTFFLILAVALSLRLWGAWRANLIFDERSHLAMANTIDLRPDHLHLVSRTLDHPLLSIYVLKLGSLVLGTSDFALRMLHLLAGTLTIVPVYFLGKRAFSESAGLWAAGLLAIDQFHVSWSRVFMPEVLLLLLSSLALLQFLRALERNRTRDFLLLGVLLGLAYLAKEPAILLIPALWLYLLVTPCHRQLLRRSRWYLAHGALLLVVAPDLIWNLSQWTESYLYRDLALVSEPFQFSMKPLSLYLGEIFRLLIDRDVLDLEYEQSNVYACHWAAGVLYLASVIAAVRLGRDPNVRLLLVVFFVVFGVFLLMPGGARFEPFWWASITLIPAVLCAGWALDWAARSGKAAQLAAFLLLGYLGIHCLIMTGRPGPYFHRPTAAEVATDFVERAYEAVGRGELREAHSRFIYALNINGPDAEAYCGLALVASRRGKPGKAEGLLSKCLELDPQHQRALELLESLGAERQPVP